MSTHVSHDGRTVPAHHATAHHRAPLPDAAGDDIQHDANSPTCVLGEWDCDGLYPIGVLVAGR